MNQPPIRPTILSQSHVSKALGDPRFFELLPEFRSLQVKLQTMKVDLQSKRGCSGCRAHRAVSNLFNDFVSIAAAMGSDSVSRLRTYLGVAQLMVNRVDPITKQVQLRTL
jgi:hypothetical protein